MKTVMVAYCSYTKILQIFRVMINVICCNVLVFPCVLFLIYERVQWQNDLFERIER